MQIKRMFGQLAAVCLLLTATAVLAADNQTAAAKPPQNIQELQARLTDILKQSGVPGAGIALFDRNGITWAGGIGFADRDMKKPVTANTLFRAGSVTKGFVAVALLQLAEQGKLDLNARLHDLAPEIPLSNPWAQSDPVTVAEVLEHTAGFDDMHFPHLYNFHDDPEIPLLTVIKRSAPELRVRWRPGSRMSYSNDDYLIAGYLLEKLTGESYEQYVTGHVLRPLGMDHASLILDATTRASLAQGYEGGNQHAVAPIPIYLRPAGMLVASPAELAHFGVMLLDRGQWQDQPFLTAASVTRMETPETTTAAKRGLAYGYGLANYTSYIDGYEFHGHDGGIDGFVSRYAYAPDQGVGFVLLVNSASPGKSFEAASNLIVSYLMQGKPKPRIPSPAPASASVLTAMTGYYREENPRNQVIAFVDYLLGVGHLAADGKGGLAFHQLFNEPQPLVPAGGDLWRNPKYPGADTIFYTRDDGRKILDLDPGAFGSYLVKTGPISAYGPFIFVCLVLLLMLSSIASVPVWVVRLLRGRMRGVRHWSVRLLPLAATAMFTLMLVTLMSFEPIELGTVNPKTVTFFLSSILFALLSAAAVVQSLRAFRWDVHPFVRWHSLAIAAGCFGLTLFLAYWGVIGLRFWNF